MKRYKLVTQDYKTRKGMLNETTWEIGKTVEAVGDPDQGLCSDACVHCYDSSELAVFLNPIHADIKNPRMLVVETHGRGKNDRGTKRGYRSMTPVEEIDCPQPTRMQCVAFGILCAKRVCRDKRWNEWADKWLSSEDRSATAITAAYAAYAAAAADTAAYAAATAANYAANAAVNYAANAATYVSAEDYAATAADYAADAATYVSAEDYAAATAANYAADAAKLNLVAIAREAMKY